MIINGISFLREYRIKNCRNKKPLPFDFALFKDIDKTNLNFLIEFQGKQHYTNTYWSNDLKKSEKEFEQRKINDNIKRKFCNKNNIKLVEIPYWDIKKIDKILKLHCLNIKE